MYTQDELESKTTRELAEIFNNIPGTKPVKRFSNKEVGVRRVLAVLPDEQLPPPASLQKLLTFNAPSKSVAKRMVAQTERIEPLVDERPKKRGRKRAERGIYNEPLGQTLRTARPSSGRGRLLEMLLTGATFSELQAALPQWTEDQLHRHIRNTHFYLGYRLTTDDNGVIRAFSE